MAAVKRTTSGMSAAAAVAERLRRSPWGIAIVAVAVIAVAAALVVAVRGLLQNPVRSTDPAGVSTLQGTFFPYECRPRSCRGYLQAGGRSVFVVLPPGCPEPSPQSDITVRARPASALGTASYAAIACPSPG